MKELIYLDNSATLFPKPKEVLDFMDSFYRHYGVNPGRSGYDLCMEAEQMVQETRKLLTEFFHGTKYEHLVFTYNASDSLNMIINGILKPGDHVITTTLEHNSVLRPLHHKYSEGMIEVDYIPFDPQGYVDPNDFRKRFKKSTKLLIINHGSNVLGTVQPVQEIGKLCREQGVIFAIDAAQTAGAEPIDVERMNIDLVAFTGHKSLMGPTGIGGLYVGEDIEIEPSRMGGTGVRSAYPFHLPEYPYRLECGTLNVLGIAGLNAGQKYLRKEGEENIRHKKLSLLERLQNGLMEVEGVTLYGSTSLENRLAVLSFNIEGYEAIDTGTLLDVDYNIATRTGLHCAPKVHEQLQTMPEGAVRVSIGPFNTEEHIDHCINAVKEIASTRKG